MGENSVVDREHRCGAPLRFCCGRDRESRSEVERPTAKVVPYPQRSSLGSTTLAHGAAGFSTRVCPSGTGTVIFQRDPSQSFVLGAFGCGLVALFGQDRDANKERVMQPATRASSLAAEPSALAERNNRDAGSRRATHLVVGGPVVCMTARSLQHSNPAARGADPEPLRLHRYPRRHPSPSRRALRCRVVQ